MRATLAYAMTFDPHLAQCIRELHASTWYIHGQCVQVTHPTPFALQGVQLRPSGSDLRAPRGVAWVHGPGPYAGTFLTILRAPHIAALAGERGRLSAHVGPGWSVEPLETQMPVIAAALRGRIDEPAGGEAPRPVLRVAV